MKNYPRSLSLSVSLCLFLVSAALCQDLDDVVIYGEVVNVLGESVAGAEVTCEHRTSHLIRTIVTGQNGKFRLTDLRPGDQVLTVRAEGFSEFRTELAGLESGSSIGRVITLEPEGVYTELRVDVEDPPASIDTESALVRDSIPEKDLDRLPNSSGDVLDLVFILNGVSEEPFSIDGLASDDRIGSGSERDRPSEVTGAGSYSLGGGAAYSTNITIDGLDNNDDREASERFQPPLSAVEEVQVVTNQYSAEYGRASGGRLNIRTKDGGAVYRGRIDLAYRSHLLNANTYNNNRRGLGRLPFSEIDSGVSAGGPIPFGKGPGMPKFFAAISSRRRKSESQIDTVLPVDPSPLFPLPPPTQPGEARPDDYPDPASDTFPLVSIAPYRKTVPTPSDQVRVLARLDLQLVNGSSVGFSYQQGRSSNYSQYRETTRYLEETLQGRTRKTDSVSISGNLVLGPSLVNQARFQYSYYGPGNATKDPRAPVVLLFISDDSLNGHPDQVRGTVVVGNSTANFSSLRKEHRYQAQNTLTAVTENRTLRLGFDAQAITSLNEDLGDSTGTYNFARVYDLLAGTPSRYRRSFGFASLQKNTYYSLFIQNEWRPAGGLTMNAGIRYERETIIGDRNNFGPRVSAAWAPFEGASTVLRIGAGIFYNRVLLRTIDDYTYGAGGLDFDSETLAGPSNERRCLHQADPAPYEGTDKCRFLRAIASSFPDPPDLRQLRELLGLLQISTGGFRSETNFTRLVEKGIQVPESYQFSAGAEHDLGAGFTVRVNFSFNKAARLWRETNINAYRPPDGFANHTEYLLSLGSISINGTPTRFVLGDPGDPVGVSEADGLRTVNLMSANPSEAAASPIGIAFAALEATLARPHDDSLGQVELVGDIGRSVHEGLAVSIGRQMRGIAGGFAASFRAAYDLSRTRDDGFVDTSSAQSPGDFASEFSASGIDRRHRLRISGIVESPSYLGRVRMSSILRLESARPFNVSIGGTDRNLDDVSNDRPGFRGDTGDIVSRGPDAPYPSELAERFFLSPIGSPGTLKRNAGRGPSLFVFNAAFSREFHLGDRLRIRPQITMDNILNATVFSFGSDYIDLADRGTGEFARGFLVPSRTLSQRKVRLDLKIDF